MCLVEHTAEVGVEERFVDVAAQTVVFAYAVVFLIYTDNGEVAAADARDNIVEVGVRYARDSEAQRFFVLGEGLGRCEQTQSHGK